MKFKIFTAVVICLVLMPFCVLAKESEYSINIPGNFTVGYTEKDLSKVAKITDMDTSALTDYCKQNGVIFVAVNSDNTEQMRLFSYETELSKKAENFQNLSNSAIDSLASEIGTGKYERVQSGGTVFLKFTEVLTDNGGEYISCQYLTIKNGKVFQFSTYNQGSEQSESLKKSFESLKFNEVRTYNTKQKIIIAAVISALVVLIGIMIYGIIKDLKGQ